MDRGIPVSSKIISKKINDRNREIHLKKLNNIKSSLNTKAPPTFSHLKPDNKKKNKFKDTRLAEIEAENKNLLDKLTQIMKPKDREALAQQNGQGRSLNHDYRKRELVKITIENEAFLKRLQEQRPTYTSSNWQRDHVQNKLYLRNICEFPMMPASTKGLRMTEENGELSRNGTSSFNSVRNNGTGSKNFNSTFTNKFNQSQTKLGPLKKPNTGKLDPIEDSSAKSILYQGRKKIGLGNYLIHVYIHNDLFNIVASNNDRSDFKTLSISRREGEILIRKFDGDLEELTNYIKFRGNKIIIDTSAEHQEDLTNIEEASVDKNEDQAGIVIIEKDTKVVAEQEEPKIVEQPKTQPSSANHSEGSQEARNQKDRLSNVPEEESPEKRKQTVEEEEEAVNAKEEQEEKEEQQEQEENNGEEENVEAEENKEEIEEGVDEEVGEDI